ncbi:hypothetical protein KP79_PYT17570 [Mizuhopecten yessoensis]|uniref:Uncharacterized protein n=1 Tax=Mizuhopecten yessoensis TaxID=6573 RepID=A0A210QVJ2_MIZYE|nr:hypothetical protein KP79_PYT17570 [Mizuhopecten yessoensis]
MLKQFTVPVPKSVSGENVFIYPLNVSPLDNHRIKTPANGSSPSTYWKSPYYGPDTKHLDIQFKNTELYNATISKQLEAKEKSVKSILKNSLPPSLLDQCVPERARKPEGCKAEVGKPKYNLRQALSPSESRSSGKKEKKVKFDDRYGRLSAIESKYRLQHSERKGSAKVRSEKTNSVKESLFSLQADRNLELTEQEHDLAHAVSSSDRSSVFNPQETDGGLQNTSFFINGDRQLEQRSEHESSVPEVIVERLNSVDISNGDEEESDIQKNGKENMLKLEETTDDFCERIPLNTENVCGVNVGLAIDTSGVHVSNKSKGINVQAQDTTAGKRTKTLVKSKTAPDLLMTRYAHNYDLRGRRGSLDDSHLFSRIALGRRRISGKTTVNTLGGAVVTRSHIRPVMFSRLSRESSHHPVLIESRQQSYRNFCDKSKTSQIVGWLEHVKEIQSREGPCIQADSDIDKDK